MSTTKDSHFDSRIDTLLHRAVVQQNLRIVIEDLLRRLIVHDESKLHSPEREVLDRFPVRPPYGTPEYFRRLAHMEDALLHHERANDHHPGFHKQFRDMPFPALMEMLCDWLAVAEATGGDIFKSIDVGQSRYGYGDELKEILIASARDLLARKTNREC